MSNTFLACVTISVLVVIISTTWSLKREISTKRIFIASLCAPIISIPITGIQIGTWYSHGFDIPWWIFGVVNAMVIVLATLSVIYLVKYHLKRE